jgi:hypothetical protein
VIGAAKIFCAAGALRDYGSSVVAADVEKAAHNAVVTIHNEDPLAGDIASDVLSRIADLIGTAGELPRSRQDTVLF